MVLTILTLLGCFLGFSLLARFWPCNPGQRAFLPKGLPDDMLYFLTGTLVYTGLSAAILSWVVHLFLAGDAPRMLQAMKAGYGLLPHLPLAVQVLIVLVVTDVFQYWVHRGFHHSSALWPFHAVHHSAEEVNWTTTFRNHPVNLIASNTTVAVATAAMGFSPLVFVIVGPFNFISAAMVHANVNWTFGPFRYVLSSPVFHRWHHVMDLEARDKNFAPTFPVLDLIFGTFYMPKGRLPEVYGAEGVPSNFLGQLIYPLKVTAERLAAQFKPGFRSRPA